MKKITKKCFSILILALGIVFVSSCSTNDEMIDTGDDGLVTLTIEAGTVNDFGTKQVGKSRAQLSEQEGKNYNPWLWENDDKLTVIDKATGSAIGELTLASDYVGKEKGKFSGKVKLQEGHQYNFVYYGSAIKPTDGKFTVDLSHPFGLVNDLKKTNVLFGTSEIVMEGEYAKTEKDILLKNLFAVAHFLIKPKKEEEACTGFGLRGEGIYNSATIDLRNGTVVGQNPVGQKWNRDTNIMFKEDRLGSKGYDFFLTLVPGEAAPTFDIYTTNSFPRNIITDVTEETMLNPETSFVSKNGVRSKFTVTGQDKSKKEVYFTNGNLQYVLPAQTYTVSMPTLDVRPNVLYRVDKEKPIKEEGTLTVQQGYYRLASHQWETAVPNVAGGAKTVFYEQVNINGETHLIGKTANFFDMFSFGNVTNPTRIDNVFSTALTGELDMTTVENGKNDWGSMVKVNDRTTRTLTWYEWDSMWNKRFFSDAPTTKMWALTAVDMNGNGKYDNGEFGGIVFFPDGMTKAEADKLFLARSSKTYTNVPIKAYWMLNVMAKETIENGGVLFLPATGYRTRYTNKVVEVGSHCNYWTSTFKSPSTTYCSFAQESGAGSGVLNPNTPPSGNAVRLAQYVNP